VLPRGRGSCYNPATSDKVDPGPGHTRVSIGAFTGQVKQRRSGASQVPNRMDELVTVSVDERDLVDRARRGDSGAFNKIVTVYQQGAYNVAYRLVGDADSAADATQDAFLSAFLNLGSYRGGSFRAWLFRIVTNSAYDILRRRERRPALSLDALVESETNPVDFPDNAELPEESLVRGELAAHIHVAISQLPYDQRVALVLCDVQGLSYDEIADATGSSIGTVKSRISRARAHVRTNLLTKRELIPARFRHERS
jgi:RNA polymerase sigma-70 factor, ECF subfamily